MTTATLTRTPAPAVTPWWRLAQWMVIGHLSVWGIFVGLVLVAAAIGWFVISRVGGATPSILVLTASIAPWVTGGVSVYYASTWLGPCLSAGLTRRSVHRASVAAALVIGIVGGPAVTALILFEHWLYGLWGWTPGSGRSVPPQAPLVGYTAGMAALLVVAALTGLLIGFGYKRFGARATFGLPVMVLPALAVLILGPGVSTIVVDGQPFGLDGWPGALLIVAALAYVLVATHLMVRRIPV